MKKIKLHELQVKSFVTELDKEQTEIVNGGANLTGVYPTGDDGICYSIVPTKCCTGYYPSINAPCTNDC